MCKTNAVKTEIFSKFDESGEAKSFEVWLNKKDLLDTVIYYHINTSSLSGRLFTVSLNQIGMEKAFLLINQEEKSAFFLNPIPI